MPKTDAINGKRPPACGGARVAFLVGAFFAVMLCQACNVVSDSQLKEDFEKNRERFVRLAGMTSDDRSLQGVGFNTARPSASGISKQRWDEYQALLQTLNLKCGVSHRPDFTGATFFCAECQGSAISRDCKGYVYSMEPVRPLDADLDRLMPGVHFESLSGPWYIFRDGG